MQALFHDVSAGALLLHIDQRCQHLVGDRDNLRVALEAALRDDHVPAYNGNVAINSAIVIIFGSNNSSDKKSLSPVTRTSTPSKIAVEGSAHRQYHE